MQLRLDEANVTITTEQNLVGSLRKELLECQITISRQEGCQRATEQVAEKCARDTEQQIRELDSKTSSLRSELDEKQQVISELTRRLAIAETPSDQHEQELLVMKARVDELEQSEKQLIQRATNITVRHEHGDLVRVVIIARWLLTSTAVERQRVHVGSEPRPKGQRSLRTRACGEE